MVQNHRQDVICFGESEQLDPEGCLARHVEPTLGQLDQSGHQRSLVDARGLQLGEHVLGAQNDLLRRLIDLWVDGAQSFVPRDYVAERLRQRACVDLAGQSDHERQVVCGGLGVEAVEEPHPLLRQRQG